MFNRKGSDQFNKKQSLASTVEAIKATSYGKKNKLINQLYTEISHDGSPSLIKYRAANGANLDESDLHQAFIDMFVHDAEINYTVREADGNGFKLMMKKVSSRDLAIDLIKYTYLSGGVQEAGEFTKYIPLSVLNHLGFSDELNNIDFSDMNLYGEMLNEKAQIEDASFIEQFIQHNPQKAALKLPKKDIISVEAKNDSKILEVLTSQILDYESGSEVVTSFKPKVNADRKVFLDDNQKLFKYVSAKFGDSYMLYKLTTDGNNDAVYKSIPVLGVNGMYEYNANLQPGEVTKSMVKSRNYLNHEAPKNVELSDKTGGDINVGKTTPSDVYDLEEIDRESGSRVYTLLATVLTKTTNNPLKTIISKLLSNQHLTSSLSTTGVSYSSRVGKAAHELADYGGELKFNDKYRWNGIIDFEQAVTHEAIHAYTRHTMQLVLDKNYREANIDEYNALSQDVIDSVNKIENIRRAFIYKLKNNPEFKDGYNQAVIAAKGVETLSQDNLKYYGFATPYEFVAEALTRGSFRKLLDENSINGKESMWSQL